MQKKHIIIITIVGIALLFAALFAGRTTEQPLDTAVVSAAGGTAEATPLPIDVQTTVTEAGLSPASVEIQAGDVVGWRNEGQQFAVVNCKQCAFSSGILLPEQSYAYQFNITGTFVITADSRRQQRIEVK